MGNNEGIVKCYDVTDGKEIWSTQLKGKIVGNPAVVKGNVIMGSTDHNIYALDAKTGVLQWKVATDEAQMGSVASWKNTVYIAGSDHKMRALDARTGKEVWTFNGVEGYVVTMPLVKILEGSVEMTIVPMSAMLLVLVGLCTSVMWASIFNLATEGLGKYTAQASGIFMMMVVGGGVLPVVQNFFADVMGYMPSYFIYLLAVAYMFYYALIGCKNVNKDIPVD